MPRYLAFMALFGTVMAFQFASVVDARNHECFVKSLAMYRDMGFRYGFGTKWTEGLVTRDAVERGGQLPDPTVAQ